MDDIVTGYQSIWLLIDYGTSVIDCISKDFRESWNVGGVRQPVPRQRPSRLPNPVSHADEITSLKRSNQTG